MFQKYSILQDSSLPILNQDKSEPDLGIKAPDEELHFVLFVHYPPQTLAQLGQAAFQMLHIEFLPSLEHLEKTQAPDLSAFPAQSSPHNLPSTSYLR